MTHIQALADERKTLKREMDDCTLEIKRLIDWRFGKWLSLQQVEREMRAIGKDLEP